MAKSEPVPASFWWRSVDNDFEKVTREFLKRAKAADLRDTGHDCGHEFTITVSSQMHVSGPGEHTDADWDSETRPVTVRAHNLRDALLLAAAEPLTSWFEEESDPLDTPPADHGSDRYDYIEVSGAPDGQVPSGEWWDRLVAGPCPDCRANVFVRWAPQYAHGWSVKIAHDDGCPRLALAQDATDG